MKKLLCMILALIMVVSLCACGQEKPKNDNNASNQTNQNGENNSNGATGEPSEEIKSMMSSYEVIAAKLKGYANGEEIYSYVDDHEVVGGAALSHLYQRLTNMEELDAWYGSEWLPKDDPDTEWNRQKLLAGFSVQKDVLLKQSCVITTQTEDTKTFDNAYVWEYNTDGTVAKVSFVDMLYTKLYPFWLDIPAHLLYEQNRSGKNYYESVCSISFAYDENGKQTKIKRHATTENQTRDLINLELDANGKMISAKSVDEDGSKQDYTFTYDAQGRLICVETNSMFDQYTYNENGQLLQADRYTKKGVVSSYKYTYDADGKLMKVEYDDRISWATSKKGKVEVTFTYDDLGRPATTTYSEGYFPLNHGQTLDFSKVEFQYVYGDYCTYAPAK